MNALYFSDCLDVLKKLNQQHPEGFIDLIYIDPPFNSKRDYNVLFESLDLTDTKAQKQAFSDTWSNVSYLDSLNEIQDLELNLYNFLKTLDNINISQSAVSYLTTMAIRIYYMRKVLNDTGSFYLHCDPTMSHYLKIICDLIFEKKNFRNEVVWKRTYAHNDPKQMGRNADRILFYSKSDNYVWNAQYSNYDDGYIKNYFKYEDERGKYRIVILTGPKENPNDPTWKGYNPKQSGRSWSVPKRIVTNLAGETDAKKMDIISRLELLEQNNYIVFSKNGIPGFKQYINEMEGVPLQEIWTDIFPISSQAKERLGYPTQKPEKLLERIINASSNKNDIVADFFCGCGTSIAVAQRLKRNWIGVDISHLAIKLIIDRLTKGLTKQRAMLIKEKININGFPKDIASAKMLASEVEKGRLKFQDWIIEVMLGGISNERKTADGGFDGYMTFYKNEKSKGLTIIEVKSGNCGVANIRSFRNVMDKQKADLGVFVCFEENRTKDMERLSKQQGYFEVEGYSDKFDKLQIITVEDLLEGRSINLPTEIFKRTTFKESTANYFEEDDENEQGELF